MKLLDPDNRFPIVLDDKCEQPQANRPTFHGRVLSCRAWAAAYDAWLATYAPELSNVDMIDQRLALAPQLICGWQNVVDPATGAARAFDPSVLADILTIEEFNELLTKALRQNRVSEDEVKNSDSQS